MLVDKTEFEAWMERIMDIRFMREKEIILKSSDNQSYYVIGNF